MMWNNFGHTGGFGLGFGWIFMILFWGLVIWAVFALVRGVSGHGCGRHHDDEHKPSNNEPSNNALDILKERYARGEISKEEFEKIKKDLE